MKTRLEYGMIAGALVAGCLAVCQAGEALAAGRATLDLSGSQWQMEGIRPGQGVKEGFHEHFAEVASSFFNWNGATVPGDVYTDLWRAGEIDDPHYGRNSLKAKWVMEKEWWYRRQFGVPENWKGRTVRLVLDGVDYACDVWLNGKFLGRHEGMFSPFEFDVSSALEFRADGRANGLVVKLDPPPRSYRNVAGRKFAWMGDYWRTLTPLGIWKPIRLEATGPVHLADVHPKARLGTNHSATVEVEVTLANHPAAKPSQARVRAVVRGKNFTAGPFEAETSVKLEGAETRTTLRVPVSDAKLWWPWELGQPDRYVVETSVFDESGALSDRMETAFGIREIRMERNPGYTREEVRNPWTMVINGKKLFLRSANWGGPPDIFYGRNTPGKYRTLVQMARDANLNNLRIFGWHPTEVEAFYDLCDELGLTVWQDLIPLASVRLPDDAAFREATYTEAVAVAKQLRRHPSVVLLEGGEEMFFGSQGLEYNADFLLGLEKAIRPYTDLPYVATSPLDWPTMLHQRGLGGPKDSGHTHLLFYAAGAKLLEDYIREWDYAVIPEFAVSSAPNVESLRRFIPPDELWPPGPSWGHHWADLDAFRALNWQVLGDERAGSLEEFVEATQVNQGVIFQWGIEHQRRRKPKSSAISICHFITFAPDFKWGIVDYFQQRKRSFDYVKRACQPLLVSLQCEQRRWQPGETFRGKLWVVNDLHTNFMGCSLRTEITRSSGAALFSKTHSIATIAADSSVPLTDVEWKVVDDVPPSFHLVLTLRDANGQALSANHYDFIRGDQAEARQEAARRSEAFRKLKEPFPAADYYRFYPDLSGTNAPHRLGDRPPAADLTSP